MVGRNAYHDHQRQNRLSVGFRDPRIGVVEMPEPDITVSAHFCAHTILIIGFRFKRWWIWLSIVRALPIQITFQNGVAIELRYLHQ